MPKLGGCRGPHSGQIVSSEPIFSSFSLFWTKSHPGPSSPCCACTVRPRMCALFGLRMRAGSLLFLFGQVIAVASLAQTGRCYRQPAAVTVIRAHLLRLTCARTPVHRSDPPGLPPFPFRLVSAGFGVIISHFAPPRAAAHLCARSAEDSFIKIIGKIRLKCHLMSEGCLEEQQIHVNKGAFTSVFRAVEHRACAAFTFVCVLDAGLSLAQKSDPFLFSAAFIDPQLRRVSMLLSRREKSFVSPH